MSKLSTSMHRVTLRDLAARKQQQQRISMVTCYDAAFARLIDDTDIDIVLVGDSLGNVVLGYENTLPVTMDMMLHHTAAVARGLKRALLVADMPFGSYQESPEKALENAVKFLQQAGAHAVKLEGGSSIIPQVKKLVDSGIPVMGHLGLTPQSVHQLGGYQVQGRDHEAAENLVREAHLLQEAGVFALVLEMVPRDLARRVTQELRISTIGIGAGADTNGQVLVLHDLLGFDREFQPKFLKTYASLGDIVTQALNEYSSEVKAGMFPSVEHSFK